MTYGSTSAGAASGSSTLGGGGSSGAARRRRPRATQPMGMASKVQAAITDTITMNPIGVRSGSSSSLPSSLAHSSRLSQLSPSGGRATRWLHRHSQLCVPPLNRSLLCGPAPQAKRKPLHPLALPHSRLCVHAAVCLARRAHLDSVVMPRAEQF